VLDDEKVVLIKELKPDYDYKEINKISKLLLILCPRRE